MSMAAGKNMTFGSSWRESVMRIDLQAAMTPFDASKRGKHMYCFVACIFGHMLMDLPHVGDISASRMGLHRECS